MTEYNVIFAGRGVGKTTKIMEEIHNLILAGRHSEIVVVFPTLDRAYFWVRAWHSRYGAVAPPMHVSASNLLKLRGKIISKVYVEDVDSYEHGIYDEKLQEVRIGLRSVLGDDEVVFTCSPLELNQRSHSRTIQPSPQEVAAKWLRERRRKKLEEDDMMLAQIAARIYVKKAEPWHVTRSSR